MSCRQKSAISKPHDPGIPRAPRKAADLNPRRLRRIIERLRRGRPGDPGQRRSRSPTPARQELLGYSEDELKSGTLRRDRPPGGSAAACCGRLR
ncbi:MAG: hypothetical protein MZV70_56340 [Desulfobacterales bacterium]|nr:hypothetical protein [Desulfobacterales bacterium]